MPPSRIVLPSSIRIYIPNNQPLEIQDGRGYWTQIATVLAAHHSFIHCHRSSLNHRRCHCCFVRITIFCSRRRCTSYNSFHASKHLIFLVKAVLVSVDLFNIVNPFYSVCCCCCCCDAWIMQDLFLQKIYDNLVLEKVFASISEHPRAYFKLTGEESTTRTQQRLHRQKQQPTNDNNKQQHKYNDHHGIMTISS